MKKVSYRLTLIILFLSTALIAGFGFIYYVNFMSIKTELKNKTFRYLLEEVQDIAKNIEYYNRREYKDLKRYLLLHPDEREKYNLFLSSFITHNYKNLFIVYKDKNSKFFRAIADGAKDPKDRFNFNEKFEPKKIKAWEKVLKEKKPVVYSTDIKGIWTTYLYPVLKDGKVDYIIVIDFSKLPLELIENNLLILKKLFVNFMFVVLIIIAVLFVFIYYDIKRQKEMQRLLRKIHNFNITLQKKVEEEVRKSREKDKQLIMQSRLALMGELLSMIAHQWRQPLNVLGSIVSNLEFNLKLGDMDENELKSSLHKMKDTIKYLSNTIEDFRKFYREDKVKEEIDINSTVGEILNIIRPSLENKNIKIITDLKCPCKIKLRKNELKQVLLNLVKNAEDVLMERKIDNPAIEIRTFKEGNICVIEVKDNAGGVDLKIKDKIFEPYFTTKDEKNGTGLGLYMSKVIVEKKLNGHIYEYNDNEGAVFRIELEVDHGCKRDN